MIQPADVIGIGTLLGLLFAFYSTLHEEVVSLGFRLIRTAKADVNSSDRKSIDSGFLDSIYVRFYLGRFYTFAPSILYLLVILATFCYAISLGIDNESVSLFGGYLNFQQPVLLLQRIFVDLISFCALLASLLFYRVTFDEHI